MQIVLLGAGGYHPNNHRHTACVMLPELGVVLDAGTGAFRIPEHLATDRLDVFLSHVHLDHVFGLTSLIGLFDGDDPSRIAVHGEAEKLAALQQHLYSPLLFPVAPNFTPTPLAGPVRVAGAKVSCFPLLGHPGGSLGFRLDGARGEAMAYVTDTLARTNAAYVEAIRGVDLLIHEANFDEEHRELADLTGHSCYADVLDVAEAAGVRRLVLVHFNPRDDVEQPLDLAAAQGRFDEVLLGRDGLVVEV